SGIIAASLGVLLRRADVAPVPRDWKPVDVHLLSQPLDVVAWSVHAVAAGAGVMVDECEVLALPEIDASSSQGRLWIRRLFNKIDDALACRLHLNNRVVA